MRNNPSVIVSCDICPRSVTIEITKAVEIVRYNVEDCLAFELTHLGWKAGYQDTGSDIVWKDICPVCAKE